MKKIITKDGSTTFFNEEFQESYHTEAGAFQEALVKFVMPCMFERLARQKREINILDVCFGLGYNSAVAIHYIRKFSDIKINIVGLENDRKIIGRIREIDLPIDEYDMIKRLSEKEDLSIEENNISINILIGDAKETIRNLSVQFDCIFLDPFSPKKNPELWSAQFIADLRNRSNRPSILTTYSCAGEVRRNMKEAGYRVEDVSPFGRRAPSTVAYLD